jgi:hypothetical protein
MSKPALTIRGIIYIMIDNPILYCGTLKRNSNLGFRHPESRRRVQAGWGMQMNSPWSNDAQIIIVLPALRVQRELGQSMSDAN